MSETYTARAVAAVIAAARSERDFAGWLAQVLAAAAGQLGSSDALIEGRPGSWEASLVDRLVKGSVGYDDAYLPGPLAGRKLTDAKAREIREAAGWGDLTRRQIAAEFGISPSTVSDIATGRSWGWLKCEPEPEEYDPGPEVDDEGGMSEYRSYAAAQDTWGER